MSLTINKTFKQTKWREVSRLKDDKPKVEKSEDTETNTSTNELDSLLKFDLQGEFGPCLGITRLERWERAERYGLTPPDEVKEILMAHPGNNLYTDCVWKKYDI